MNVRLFSSSDASKITELSTRQLQYWDKTELIYPSVIRANGRGSRRLYSERDLLQLKIIRKLIDSGMSVQSIRKSLLFLRKLFDGNHPLTELVLVSDGHSIYAYRDTDTILDTLRDGQQIFRLTLDELIKELNNQINEVYQEYSPSRID